MKIKTIKDSLNVCLVSAVVSGFAVGAATANENTSEEVADLYGSPFDSCFVAGYNQDLVDQKQAYETAQCFTTLLSKANETDYLGASTHTIMQYSASWYKAAAEKGHSQAESELATNLLALSRLENSLESSAGDIQMLASEKQFQALDIDGNGSLTLAEASVSSEIKNQFEKSDIDQDGSISFGEYSIRSGEATAAGQP